MKNIKRITIISSIILYLLISKSFAITGVVNTPATRLREEPNTESTIITNIYEDDKVEIIENSGEWCKVKYNGNTGYVKTEFLEIENTQSNTSNTTNSQENTTNQNTVDNSTSQVNTANESNTSNNEVTKISIRLLPNISSKIITQIDTVNNLTQISEVNNWVKVTDGTVTGWTIKTKLSQVSQPVKNEETQIPENNPSETPEPENKENENVEQNTNKTGKINVETAKVREKPDSNATIIDFLDYNDEVTILAEEGDWYKITSGNVSGYVSKRLVTTGVSSRSLSENREEIENNIDDTVINEEANNSVNSALSSNKEETTNTTGAQIAEYAKQYLGYSYVSGGKNPSTGFDCSGFTKYVYSNFGYTLGDTAASQNNIGVEVSKDNLNVGDLILFYDEGKTKIGHTGIYIGDGNFIHSANPDRGVVTDNLNTNSYYNSRFITAKKIVE